MKYGDRIRAKRKQIGMTIKQLADASGCSLTSISKYERNEVIPIADKACRIATALHTSVEALFGRKEYRASHEVMELKRDNARLRKAIQDLKEISLDENKIILEALFPDPLLRR